MTRSVAILIASYERPDGLAALLRALDRQDLGVVDPSSVEIVVVDNSERRSAEALCARVARRSRFRLTYLNEPAKGLSFARNTSLRAACDLNAAFVAFIDDDEVPASNWLASLLKTIEAGGATAAVGPVYPVFEHAPPAWSVQGGFFSKELTPIDGHLADGYTSNAIVRLDFIRRHGLAFDRRCNLTGGEDTLLFDAIKQHGGSIVWAETAPVFEAIPSRRMTRTWIVQRWFRTGGTIMDCRGARGLRALDPLMLSAAGAARVALGALRFAYCLVRHPHRPDRHLAALFTLSRGAGLCAAAMGRRHLEYALVSEPNGAGKESRS